jgi:hypothetical protein
MESARQAIDALQNRGIDAEDIIIRGPGPFRAAQHTDNDTFTAPHDAAIARRIILRMLPWAALGAAVGAVVGVIYAATLGIGPLGSNYGGQALSWATGGFIAGALLAAMTSLSAGDAWEMTFEPDIEGEVVISLRSGNEATAERAARILRHKDAEHVHKHAV